MPPNVLDSCIKLRLLQALLLYQWLPVKVSIPVFTRHLLNPKISSFSVIFLTKKISQPPHKDSPKKIPKKNLSEQNFSPVNYSYNHS